ncbi:MAG: 2-hydroxyacyl-CoA dehydratase family protein [Defluviitaleaceae bacterium]|nr:2-hydroxyacyl-CoA dehydratase family protein [Defluviitaleaceae bacterium]
MVSIHDLSAPGGIKNGASANLCSMACYAMEIDLSDFNGVIFTNCCNSTQRLFDYITISYPHIYSYMLEIAKTREHGINGWFNEQCIMLAESLNSFFGSRAVNAKKPRWESNFEKPEGHCIWLLGSALDQSYANEAADVLAPMQVRFELCPSTNRGDIFLASGSSKEAAARAASCPGMMDYHNWLEEEISNRSSDIDGVILVSLLKCDHIMFSYPEIRKICENFGIPMMLIEEEYKYGLSGRSRLRYEAFKEKIKVLSDFSKVVGFGAEPQGFKNHV